MNRLEAMDAFARVVKNGNFVSAASELGISPGMVTKRVQRLEATLGAKLLSRTTRRLSVTEIGRRYYKFCDRILAEMQQEDREIRRLQHDARGEIKVLSPMSFGIMQMGKLVSGFMAAYPDVQVSLTIADATKRVLDPVEFGADLAIRFSLKKDSTHYLRRLGTLHWIACASPAYLQRSGTPAAPDQLVNHSCLVTHTRFGDGRWLFKGAQGPQTVQVSGPVSPSNAITMRYMVLDGAGIALLPTFAVADDLRSGHLVRILQDYEIPDLPICALYPHANEQPRKVKLFVDFISKQLRHAPWD
ncbi:MAG TPA: LysR family transcriptional regulator [Alphaproteobacteria bacterium]|jgi:DNA-binding transcriptional LysR family regulator|nr:LysR family transcriptional regulator [Alphaproteobacteria bacterium]